MDEQPVVVKAKANASLRTRNRVKESDGDFTLVGKKASVIALGNRPAVLVRSNNRNWMGWLPEDEVTISGGK